MKKSVAIIGGGPSALILAAHLNEQKFNVTIYERNAALGRKFLVAGEGGFNLSHSEEMEKFISRYIPPDFFQQIIPGFSTDNLRDWFKNIGIETFIGSSNRVFPIKGIKPIDVLNAILNELRKKNVTIKTNHNWKGWENEKLIFEAPPPLEGAGEGFDITIFSLGGSSWKVTGSDGSWTNYFSEKNIEIIPFQASNCAQEVKWNTEFMNKAEGKILKNISIKCGDNEQKGELVITKFGLEGGAIYAMSPQIRKQLNENETATIYLDLKPALTIEQIKDKFSARGNRSIKKLLIDRLNFDDTQIELLKTILSKDDFTYLETLAKKIKALPISISSSAPIDEAISTVGGIALTEIDTNFQLNKLPDNYCIGEMLDWDAPTGGYLLHACFAMGHNLAEQLNLE
ncbi:MAG: TIGR03862 family flavoprotein [Bacteroidetes bacterium]|nr:TIGR03862 family flavoprotein [Bacteroidota bacterium]